MKRLTMRSNIVLVCIGLALQPSWRCGLRASEGVGRRIV